MATYTNPNNPGGLAINIPDIPFVPKEFQGAGYLRDDEKFLYVPQGDKLSLVSFQQAKQSGFDPSNLPVGPTSGDLKSIGINITQGGGDLKSMFQNLKPLPDITVPTDPMLVGGLAGARQIAQKNAASLPKTEISSTATPQQITPEGKPQQPNVPTGNVTTPGLGTGNLGSPNIAGGGGGGAPLGSADRTNELLRATGSNQQFTNQANQHAPIQGNQQTPATTTAGGQNSPVATTGAETSTPPPSESFEGHIQKILDVFKANGITPATSNVSPMTSIIDTYKQFYNQMGLPTIKEHYDALQKRYGDLQAELQDKIASVNNNPWLSEGLRSKEVNKVQNKYEARTAALTNELKLTESMYDHGRQEAQFWAGKGLELSHQNEVFNEGLVKNAIDLADKQLTAERALATSAATESRFERSQAAIERRFQQLHGGGGGGFTTSQTNKGANSAGLTTEEFKGLAPDVQNFYSHLTGAQAKDLDNMIKDIKAGNISPEQAKANIDMKSMTPAVKAHLKARIDNATKPIPSISRFGNPFASGSLGGFFRDVYGGAKGLFSQ